MTTEPIIEAVAKPIDMPTTHEVYVWLTQNDAFRPNAFTYQSIDEALRGEPLKYPQHYTRQRRRLFKLTLPLDALEEF